MSMRNKNTGFTIVELLVVISIIGILSAVIYAGFGEARTSAKNKAFRADMKEAQLAIELYKAQTGVYPDPYMSGSGNGSCYGTSGLGLGRHDWAKRGGGCTLNLITDYIAAPFVPEFIAALPSKARSANPNCSVKYMVDETERTWYKLLAENCVAGNEQIQPTDEMARCLSSCPAASGCTSAHPATPSFYESYAVYSAGGECI